MGAGFECRAGIFCQYQTEADQHFFVHVTFALRINNQAVRADAETERNIIQSTGFDTACTTVQRSFQLLHRVLCEPVVYTDMHNVRAHFDIPCACADIQCCLHHCTGIHTGTKCLSGACPFRIQKFGKHIRVGREAAATHDQRFAVDDVFLSGNIVAGFDTGDTVSVRQDFIPFCFQHILAALCFTEREERLVVLIDSGTAVFICTGIDVGGENRVVGDNSAGHGGYIQCAESPATIKQPVDGVAGFFYKEFNHLRLCLLNAV